jgi:tRNA C32,U32 (ribose-2'-O)-methylase TrmJ
MMKTKSAIFLSNEFDIYKNRKELRHLSETLKICQLAQELPEEKEKKKIQYFTAEEFVLRFLFGFSGLSSGGQALVFGNEEHGLTYEEHS